MDNENDISQSTSKDAKKIKKIKGVDILNSIKTNIKEDEEYSLDDVKKLVSNVYKKPVKKSLNVVKREPSAYNIFMKDEITKLRAAAQLAQSAGAAGAGAAVVHRVPQ